MLTASLPTPTKYHKSNTASSSLQIQLSQTHTLAKNYHLLFRAFLPLLLYSMAVWIQVLFSSIAKAGEG